MSEYKEFFIIITGSAASAESIRILNEYDGIKKRYSKRYLSDAAVKLEGTDGKEASTIHEKLTEKLNKEHEFYVMPCGIDGVFGALYRLGEELNLGLRVRLSDIPIEQAAIELCDQLDINPYEADSTGACLIAAESAGEVLEELKKLDIPAKLIGYTVKERSRIVLGPTERYLTKP